VWERPITRKTTARFNPQAALDLISMGSPKLGYLDEDGRRSLVQDYLEVKNLEYMYSA